jgi:hypothetical protein
MMERNPQSAIVLRSAAGFAGLVCGMIENPSPFGRLSHGN